MTSPATLNVPLSSEAVRRWYDSVGSGIERAERYESRAKAAAIRLLVVTPGARVLNVGVGAGQKQRRLQDCAGAHGVTIGLDVSPGMLAYARQRVAAAFCRADIRALPFPDCSFDFIFSACVLDLLPTEDLLATLGELRSPNTACRASMCWCTMRLLATMVLSERKTSTMCVNWST